MYDAPAKTGNVSVAYATVPGSGTPATGGQDYGEIADRLTWDDGDASERQVVVQVLDNGGVVEEAEQFRIELSDAQGGAGLGMRNATIKIRPDGDPSGQFAVEIVEPSVSESDPARVRVERKYYYDGAVSVTLTPVAGTATAGDDFIADPVTLSWADKQRGARPWKLRSTMTRCRKGARVSPSSCRIRPAGPSSVRGPAARSRLKQAMCHLHLHLHLHAAVEELRDCCRFCSLRSRQSRVP